MLAGIVAFGTSCGLTLCVQCSWLRNGSAGEQQCRCILLIRVKILSRVTMIAWHMGSLMRCEVRLRNHRPLPTLPRHMPVCLCTYQESFAQNPPHGSDTCKIR
uniref:Secreted protein n=1 Tax=Haptolina brevifila TaxID=156173 RepID=A0A7S2JTV5_9EUKA